MPRKKIIIIDDNIIDLKTASNVLREEYQVFTAPSGDKLFIFLEKVFPDIILLDIEMPDMDGFKVFGRLKENPETAVIPVIFITSSNSLDYEKRCYDLGAADFIHKPYYPPFLNKRINMHLNMKMAVDNSEVKETLFASHADLADLQMRLLKTVVELIERRDEVGGGHVARTQKYVEVLFDVLKKNNIYYDIVSTWKKEPLLQSAMLYDLGKLSVVDSILLKPDKLLEHEYSAVKEHPALGEKIINDIRAVMSDNSREAGILEYARDFAAYHHEKWDGTGYPNGLKGYNIPLKGRLMAIADVYDALISKKAYKNPYTHEEAAKIIYQGKGTHFDPILVDVFISVADQFNNIAKVNV